MAEVDHRWEPEAVHQWVAEVVLLAVEALAAEVDLWVVEVMVEEEVAEAGKTFEIISIYVIKDIIEITVFM